MNKLLLLVSMLLLSACTPETSYRLGPQMWNDIQFVVETRPSPPSAGMVEFLVIATNPDRTHAYDMIVSLRTNKNGKWKQAIQDGHVGVYRRALPIKDVQQDRLYVHIKKKRGAEGALEFSLVPPEKVQ